MHAKPRLNLFALPSQTTLVFAGILIVIGLPLVMSLTGRFGLLLPLLPVVVLLFTLWDFLAEPVRMQAAWQARRVAAEPSQVTRGLSEEAGNEDEDENREAERWLVKRVAAIAQEAGVQPAPILLKTTRSLDYPRAFGAWRQRYLLLPARLIPLLYQQAGDLNPQKARYVEVILHHELAHFANHDVALFYFARSLLQQTIFVLLAYWFALIWTPIIYQVGVSYLPGIVASASPELLATFSAAFGPQVMEMVRNPPQQTRTMMVIAWLELTMAVMPLVAGAIFLRLRDLNLLLRVRELYADARANAWLGQVAPLIADTQRWLRASSFNAGAVRVTKTKADARRWPLPRLRLAGTPPLSWPGTPVKSVLRPSPQPEKNRREIVLAQPQLAYGTVADIGRRAGVVVLLLFLIMGSLLAPAQKGIGSEIGIGLGFLVLATGLTPSAIAHLPDLRAVRRDRRRAIGFYMLVFNSVLLVALLLALLGVLLRPGDLDLVMYAIAGSLPTSTAPVMADPVSYIVQAVLGSLLVYFVGAPLLLYAFLALDFRLKQLVLRWYGADWLAQRSAQVLLLISSTLTVVLWLGVAPLLHIVAFPLIIGFDWGLAAGVLLAGLCAAALAYWLWRNDRCYRNRCPQCGYGVEVSFHLGLPCPHCGDQLQPWLAARE